MNMRFSFVFAALAVVVPARVAGQAIETVTLSAIHDTWATHDDGLVHGGEATIRVGIEPQACLPGAPQSGCSGSGLVCCPDEPYAFCAATGACASTPPSWSAFRKFRGYLRFDLSQVPDGKILQAGLRLIEVDRVEGMGGPPKVYAYRLKGVGGQCAWSEAALKDTNLTTWSSLPQDTAINESDNSWVFDVTKAAVDWLEGDANKPGAPIAENCGLLLTDPDFGTADVPLQRWVRFSSKEGTQAPLLIVTVAKDLDKDGFTGDVDCDEENSLVNPGALETCGDGIDNDCDGSVDNEACDGVDNDCDGQVDELGVSCGEGAVCVLGSCEPSCADDCEGPFDTACAATDDGGWQVLGCGQSDADPCLDWFSGELCPTGWLCTYGSCSINCVDECDDSGASECNQLPSGQWVVQTCTDFDGDGCLEWTVAEGCAAGQACDGASCSGAACAHDCPELGVTQCAGDLVQTCFLWDGPSGCRTWGLPQECPAGTCQEGGCAEEPPVEADPEPGEDTGSPDAAEVDGADSGEGDASADGGHVPPLPDATEEDPDGQDAIEEPSDAAADGAEVPLDGAGGSDSGSDLGGGEGETDEGAVGNADVADTATGGEPDTSDGGSGGGGDGGCRAGSGVADPWLLLAGLGVLGYWRRRRRSDGA